MRFHEKLERLIDRKSWKKPTLWCRLRKDGLDVGRSTVYRWVNGESTPDLDGLRSLARVLEVPVEILIHDDIDLPPADSTRADVERWLRHTIEQAGPEAIQRLIIASLLRAAQSRADRARDGQADGTLPNFLDPPDPPVPSRKPGG